MFTIYNDSGADCSLVPNLFIDKYMKHANDARIKIYLYLIRSMSSKRLASISDMAEEFNHTEREVLRSLRYWEKQGLLTLEYDANGYLAGIHLCSLSAPQTASGKMNFRTDFQAVLPQDTTPVRQSAVSAESSADSTKFYRTTDKISDKTSNKKVDKKSVSSASSNTSRKPAKEVIEAFQNDSARAQLLFIVEQYIGKPLSVNEIQVIYYIAEELHFSDSLIDYLLQYCIDRGKKDFRYIEKVAVNWAQNGITTPRQAEMSASTAVKQKKAFAAGSYGKKSNKFNQFEQNQYDFDILEAELLNNN